MTTGFGGAGGVVGLLLPSPHAITLNKSRNRRLRTLINRCLEKRIRVDYAPAIEVTTSIMKSWIILNHYSPCYQGPDVLPLWRSSG